MQTASEVIPPAPVTVKISAKAIARFWKKVSKDGPIHAHKPELGNCWTWLATTDKDGYGKFWFNGGIRFSHRLAWLIQFGEIPDRLCVCHSCDLRICQRGSHLFLGTLAENRADCCAKGRQAKGDTHGFRLHPEAHVSGDKHWSRMNPERHQGANNGNARLTEAQVLEIRRLADAGKTARELAPLYGVGKSAIIYIANRTTWKTLKEADAAIPSLQQATLILPSR